MSELQIEWPSGIVQRLGAVTARQLLTVTESFTLSMRRLEQQIEITFSGGILESTPSLSMPQWTPVAAVSPYRRAPDAATRFFRVRSQSGMPAIE